MIRFDIQQNKTISYSSACYIIIIVVTVCLKITDHCKNNIEIESEFINIKVMSIINLSCSKMNF
jgi:hypothetical protein